MRTLFFLLLLANVAFFAWWRFAASLDAGGDPLPLARQIEPEKLKIISPADLPAAPVAQKPAPPPPPPPAPPPIACLEWGSFTVADAPRVEKALEPLALGSRLTQRRSEETATWWVFIPPQGSRQGALKKAAELKALGVDDYFIMPDDNDQRWAVSLGVFRTAEAAQARLAALRGQGVRSAKAGPRETVVARVWYQVTSVDASLQARLKDLARQIEGSELKECP
ncbi:MAG TPA: SPOR domain-containing protein [Candidatus Dormibacteraeota bacterium]|nr:SPOR domain-containing protein [Candidatus Dormibacteraeota bacterium]